MPLPHSRGVSCGGTRAYYFYEGSDIALIVERAGSGYQVRSRYVTGGTDQQLVGQFPQGSGMVARLLVPDYQGSTVMALKEGDSLETQWNYCQHDAFGAFPLGTCSNGSGTANSGTGYTGAASPSAGGGFVYLRNRWYDPQTGRFLTQDPIGLAGGTNLYSYAGGNPVSFSDPMGLCPSIGLCPQFLTAAVVWANRHPVAAARIESYFKTEAAGFACGSSGCTNPPPGGGAGYLLGLAALASPTAHDLPIGVGASEVATGLEASSITRAAEGGAGNFGIGTASLEETNAAGQAWVGDGARTSSDGKALISQDGLRQYRYPTFKPKYNEYQANFESRSAPNGRWENNGHVTVVLPPGMI